jgi:hypothetical protein
MSDPPDSSYPNGRPPTDDPCGFRRMFVGLVLAAVLIAALSLYLMFQPHALPPGVDLIPTRIC